MNIERSNWRDLGISARHRSYGIACAAVDLDFILVEFDYCVPLAIIEYKNEFAAPCNMTDTNIKVLIKLGDMASLPVFCVRYKTNFSKVSVVPLNAKAELLQSRKVMSESDYVTFLYKLRSKSVPEEILVKLSKKV